MQWLWLAPTILPTHAAPRWLSLPAQAMPFSDKPAVKMEMSTRKHTATFKGYFQLFLPSFRAITLVVTTPTSALDKKGKGQQLVTRSSPWSAWKWSHFLLHPATTFSLSPLHLLHLFPSFQLAQSCQFSASFLLILSCVGNLLHLQPPTVLSAPKATKCSTHCTALLPPWAVLLLQLWERNWAAARHGEDSVPSKARGMPAFETVIMVRQVVGRRGKHSMVQSTAVYRWSNSCSEHCVVHRRWLWCGLKQLWLQPRQGRDRESSTADKGGLADCW